MRLIFVTGNYPSIARPFEGTFVQQFVWAMARQGNNCIVIKPTSIFARRHGSYPPQIEEENIGIKSKITVYRPRYFSFSSKNLFITHTGRWTQASFNRAVKKIAKTLKTPSAVYGHFLYQAGYAATLIAKEIGALAVVGVGEDHLWSIAAFGEMSTRKNFATGSYFLANSQPNRNLLTNYLGIEFNRIRVEPNGIDLSLMFPHDRLAMRNRFGFDHNDFVVVFVGTNEERKGPQRLLDAVEDLQDVKCIFAGLGTELLVSSAIVRKGPCEHPLIPLLLSSGDIFVLPTISEGSCNAVIEAMACGLPIITAKGDYMDDIVDDNVAIRVDPTDVNAIRNAILTLKNDPLRRKKMSEACLRKAQQFDINERARSVTVWMEKLIKQSNMITSK